MIRWATRASIEGGGCGFGSVGATRRFRFRSHPPRPSSLSTYLLAYPLLSHLCFLGLDLPIHPFTLHLHSPVPFSSGTTAVWIPHASHIPPPPSDRRLFAPGSSPADPSPSRHYLTLAGARDAHWCHRPKPYFLRIPAPRPHPTIIVTITSTGTTPTNEPTNLDYRSSGLKRKAQTPRTRPSSSPLLALPPLQSRPTSLSILSLYRLSLLHMPIRQPEFAYRHTKQAAPPSSNQTESSALVRTALTHSLLPSIYLHLRRQPPSYIHTTYSQR